MKGVPSAAFVAITDEVLAERIHQDVKWGESNHHPATWVLILGKQTGQASEALLDSQFQVEPSPGLARYRAELIQIAAVAVAAVENFDRQHENLKP